MMLEFFRKRGRKHCATDGVTHDSRFRLFQLAVLLIKSHPVSIYMPTLRRGMADGSVVWFKHKFWRDNNKCEHYTVTLTYLLSPI